MRKHNHMRANQHLLIENIEVWKFLKTLTDIFACFSTYNTLLFNTFDLILSYLKDPP